MKALGKRTISSSLVLVCLGYLAGAPAHADTEPLASPPDRQLWLTTGFLSYHFNRTPHYNERNTGIGIEYDFGASQGIAIGHYRNSVRAASTYIQYVYTPLGLGPFRLGAAVGVVNGYPLLREARYTPVLIPAVKTSFTVFGYDAGLNFTYIPTIARHVDGSFATQFKVRID